MNHESQIMSFTIRDLQLSSTTPDKRDHQKLIIRDSESWIMNQQIVNVIVSIMNAVSTGDCPQLVTRDCDVGQKKHSWFVIHDFNNCDSRFGNFTLEI